MATEQEVERFEEAAIAYREYACTETSDEYKAARAAIEHPCEFCEAAADGLVALSKELDGAKETIEVLDEDTVTLADVKAAFQAYLIAQGYPAAPVGSISPELDALVDLLI